MRQRLIRAALCTLLFVSTAGAAVVSGPVVSPQNGHDSGVTPVWAGLRTGRGCFARIRAVPAD